jgi:hypothetical protein
MSDTNFYEVSDDTKKIFFDIFNKKSFPISIKFEFLGSEKQKDLLKISKVSDQYSFLLKKEILVMINEDILNVFDEESVTILIEQEIDRISVNGESGKIKLIKPDLSTFSALINKYGVEKVARANKVEELYQQQVKDGKHDEEFIV